MGCRFGCCPGRHCGTAAGGEGLRDRSGSGFAHRAVNGRLRHVCNRGQVQPSLCGAGADVSVRRDANDGDTLGRGRTSGRLRMPPIRLSRRCRWRSPWARSRAMAARLSTRFIQRSGMIVGRRRIARGNCLNGCSNSVDRVRLHVRLPHCATAPMAPVAPPAPVASPAKPVVSARPVRATSSATPIIPPSAAPMTPAVSREESFPPTPY